MQREEKNKVSESRRFNYKKGVKGGNVDGAHQKIQVPSSSSEPTLVQMNTTIGPSLRETSSWSNPSDTTYISQHKNIQFNVVDAMNPIGDLKEKKKGLKEVNLDKLREECRRLIIPLMQRVMNENPPDLVAYCAQYFQELLVLRQEEKKISNCKLLDDFNGKNDKGYPEDQIEKSSLPTLFQMNDSFGPLLFENVSWNDTSSAPWTVKNTNNLKAAEKKIRDQANISDKFHNKEDCHLLEETERKNENMNQHKSSDRKTKEKGVSFKNDKKSPEVDNAKSDIHVLSQPSNLRTRWSEPDTLVKKITKSPTSSGTDSNSSDSDDFDTSYEMLQNEDTIPLNPKIEDSISDSCHERSLPDEKNNTRVDSTCLKKKDNPPGKQELSIEELESFVQSLFQTLRQNVQLAEVEIKERIQQIKKVKSNASVNKQSQLLPRKKRSITTLESTFKDGGKDGGTKYSGYDPDVPKGLLKDAKDPRRNHKSKTDASEDSVQSYQQKNTKRGKEEGNKNRSLVHQGFSNPAFSFDQESIHSNNSVFMRPRKHEWIRPSTTDSTQEPRNIRIPTNLSPVRADLFRPLPTYTSSSSLPMRPPANSNISNIGDGDVLSLNQNVCSIAIETDNPTTIERSSGSNARIRPNHNIESKNYRDAPKKEKTEKASKREENNQINSIALKGNSSKGRRTERTGTIAPGELERSQSTAEELKHPSKETSEKRGLEKKLSNLDLMERIRSSNLNPCAPVFSPSSRSFVPNEATNSSTTNDSGEGRRRWDRTPRLDIALLTETDLSIDAVAWDCLRNRNLHQAHENGVQELPLRDLSGDFDGRVREFEPAFEDFVPDGSNYNDAGPESKNPLTNTEMVEGDRTPSTKHDNKADSKFERAEPSLNPACGDFVLSEDNVDKPLQNGTVEENSNSLSSPGSDDSVEGKAEESEQRLDEEGLNFACLSGSGSSEGYSSELSEEEEYEEEK